MKTNEELNVVNEDDEAMNKKLTELNDDELKEFAGGHGSADGKQSWEYANYAISLPTYIHKNCGGRIISGDIFHNCRCEKCGEEHYFLESCNYTKVYGIDPPTLED